MPELTTEARADKLSNVDKILGRDVELVGEKHHHLVAFAGPDELLDIAVGDELRHCLLLLLRALLEIWQGWRDGGGKVGGVRRTGK